MFRHKGNTYPFPKKDKGKCSLSPHLDAQDQFNIFLDILKDSGCTNMFGAVPYIMFYMDVTEEEARIAFSNWMDYQTKIAKTIQLISQ